MNGLRGQALPTQLNGLDGQRTGLPWYSLGGEREARNRARGYAAGIAPRVSWQPSSYGYGHGGRLQCPLFFMDFP